MAFDSVLFRDDASGLPSRIIFKAMLVARSEPSPDEQIARPDLAAQQLAAVSSVLANKVACEISVIALAHPAVAPHLYQVIFQIEPILAERAARISAGGQLLVCCVSIAGDRAR